jgi:hypothetical protein
MHLGDIGFILAFIVLPILIIIGCISALRVVRRRAAPPPPPFDEPAEPRDWAASVRPIRGQSGPTTHVQTEARPFRTPEYRGKQRGSVRRLNAAALKRGRKNDPGGQ